MIASLWAFPISLAGLIYAELFRLFGWYEFLRKQDGVRIYQVSFRAPMQLLHLWSNWAGQTVGEVIVHMPTASDQILVHEFEHVRQCRVLGIFQPVLYGLCSLAILLGCPRSSAYQDNPFEREARRAAGQET